MDYRQLGRTDMRVSVISFGAWAIGGSWGQVDDEASMRALHAAIDAGTNFIDTADVYGDGRSERLVARLRRERPNDTIYVATKAGRRLPSQTVEGYSRENLSAWVDRSLQNLDTEAVDLLQLHCPPSEVIQRDEVFGILDDLVTAGKLRYYGVSVETVDEALAAMRHPHVRTIQIIFNMFRMKPAARVLPEAAAARCRRPRARAARERPADREDASPTRCLPPTIIACSTARARRSTRERRCPACRMKQGSRRSTRCGRSFPPARPWRSSRSDGS